MSDYVPPTLEQSGSVSIAPLKDRHRGEVCYIVGKGTSLVHLRYQHVGPGPVLVLNGAIQHVQTLGIPNQIYVMQKDGCMTEDPETIPRPCGSCEAHGWQRDPVINPLPGIACLFSQHLSSWCLHGRPNRFVFTDAELGYAGYPTTMSVLESIPLAQHFGCSHIVMVCFDSLVNGNLETFGDYTDAQIVELRRCLEWVKPRVLASLARMPHSFFVPVGT